MCNGGNGIGKILQSHRLNELAASLFVYAKAKAALSQPKELKAGEVPHEYVKLAKNCVAATFAASNLSAGSNKR